MNIFVLLGHQRPESFCHAIADAAIEELRAAGHDVVFRDLYAEKFDPVLTDAEVQRGAKMPPEIQQHCDELIAADGYVIIHPNWWAMPPAILKGWIDRVFRQGICYEFGPNGVIGHLNGKTAQIFTTSNTPRDVEMEVYGDPLENLWKTCIFGMCGLEDFERRNYESIVMSSPEDRDAWIAETRETIRRRFPVA